MSSALEDGLVGGWWGLEVRGFDISSLISCFTAAWRLTLMHWKDVVLTAHHHIHVQSPLAQESSGLRIIHSEKLKWKWVCSAVLLISGLEKKNEVMTKRIGIDNETRGGWKLLFGRRIPLLLNTTYSGNPSMWKTKATHNVKWEKQSEGTNKRNP